MAALSAPVLLAAIALGMIEDREQLTLQSRTELCDAVAAESEQLLTLEDRRPLERALAEFVRRGADVESAGIRAPDGTLLVSAGEHATRWPIGSPNDVCSGRMRRPLQANSQALGVLEVAFTPLSYPPGDWLSPPRRLVLGFCLAMNAALFFYYLSRTLTELDPKNSVPDRVRSALDTLVEGLLVLDRKGRIVLVNKAFAAVSGLSIEHLLGKSAADLPWRNPANSSMPWDEVLRSNRECTGAALGLDLTGGQSRSFVVNAAPILDQRGVNRGVLASFDDVTPLETKQAELARMLAVLQDSREKIVRQNEDLRYLATRDPMTGCLNRRSFFEQFETLWQAAASRGRPLCCIMVDVDHFKSINDNFGHSMGDEVLKKVAATLLGSVDSTGLVCRFGGEEFCVLLAGADLEAAAKQGEVLREAMAAMEFPGLKVTASFGVSGNALGASTPQEALDQADKALYHSKRTGRNRVTRWDHVPADAPQKEDKPTRSDAERATPADLSIPYQAVSSLLAALSYRDPDTAVHSQRVADLVTTTAKGLVSAGDIYLLETAALLHDIGKIGVSDSILLKPDKLSAEESALMNLQAQIGVEIARASFQSPRLVDIMRFQHARFDGEPLAAGLPRGIEIPLGARLIAICNRFDELTVPATGGDGLSARDACAVLEQEAGGCFDPELVARFMERCDTLQAACSDRSPSTANSLTNELALNLGLQIERLSQAIDQQEFSAVQALAGHLEATAAKGHVEPVRAAAAKLGELSGREPDLAQMVQVMHEIIDLSLAAQQAALAGSGGLAHMVQQHRRRAVQAEATS